jgi:hypothetical protein
VKGKDIQGSPGHHASKQLCIRITFYALSRAGVLVREMCAITVRLATRHVMMCVRVDVLRFCTELSLSV